MIYVILCHELLLRGLPKIDFCCNYFEVLHLYKLPASAYFIRYKVRGGAFDLAVEVTQVYILYTYSHSGLKNSLNKI